MGSSGTARITVVVDTGENGSGNNVPQPPCRTITNSARLVLEQRQLGFLYTVVSRDIATVRNRGENTTAVDHLLAHKVNFTIAPCTAGSTTIRNSVRQIDSVFQNMTAERTLDSGLSLFKIALVHCRTNIAAIGRIGTVHSPSVQASVRHDNYMVGSTARITTVEVVIERRNAVVDTADSPVVTDVQILECTSFYRVVLSWCYCIS